ncbi:MAG: hypothetical protein Q9162_001584 [Coniocarpon cinnabarinum]
MSKQQIGTLRGSPKLLVPHKALRNGIPTLPTSRHVNVLEAPPTLTLMPSLDITGGALYFSGRRGALRYAVWSAFFHPSPPARYSSLVVFGDSFSDNGNEFRLSNQSWPADPAYFHGRFSNGLEWNEVLAHNLSIPLHNYAYAGATTDNALAQGYSGHGSTLPVPSLSDQVQTFLQQTPPDAPLDSSLFAFLGGANDVIFDPNITAIQSVGAISMLVTRLRNAGAQNFLLLNYPDLSNLPYNFYIPLEEQMQFRDFSHDLDAGLTSLHASLVGSGRSPTQPTMSAHVRADYVNLMPLFETFNYWEGGWREAGFDKFGLYGSCLVGAYVEQPQRTLCNNPEQHVFWDEYHPTAVSHRIIAQTIMGALG